MSKFKSQLCLCEENTWDVKSTAFLGETCLLPSHALCCLGRCGRLTWPNHYANDLFVPMGCMIYNPSMVKLECQVRFMIGKKHVHCKWPRFFHNFQPQGFHSCCFKMLQPPFFMSGLWSTDSEQWPTLSITPTIQPQSGIYGDLLQLLASNIFGRPFRCLWVECV